MHQNLTVACILFGNDPSAQVRGKLRVQSASKYNINWEIIQLYPSNINSVKYAFTINRFLNFFLGLLVFAINLRLIINADVIYAVKRPPKWFSFVISKLQPFTILDFDDPIWIDGMMGQKWFDYTISKYDGFTCDNEYLLNEVIKMNKCNSKIKPGLLLLGELPEVKEIDRRKSDNSDSRTLIWVGSPSTAFYLKEISNELREILLSSNQIKLTLLGLTYDQALELGLEINQVKCVPSYSEEVMLTELFLSDIGIFPLNMEPLSYLRGTHKANLYSHVGIPTVASNIQGVDKSVVHGFNGYICASRIDWKKYLTELVNDKDKLALVKIGALKKSKNYQLELSKTFEGLIKFIEFNCKISK